jgi:hypothetical protein
MIELDLNQRYKFVLRNTQESDDANKVGALKTSDHV